MNSIIEVLVDILILAGLRKSTGEGGKHNKKLSIVLLLICTAAIVAMGILGVYGLIKIIKPQ